MQALRLVPSQPRDEAIYRGMRVQSPSCRDSNHSLTCVQDEAIGVYNRLNSDRSSLVEQQRLDASIRPPFFWHHIRPERRRQAIVDTWQHARPGSDPRRFFDLGATAGEHAPNWVTLWLLYSVFRSRDVRNNRNRRTGEGGSLGGASGML